MNGQLSEHRIFFNEVADAIAHDLEREASRGIALGGATNLLKHPEYSDFGKASGLLSVLETKEKLYQILTKATPMEFTISIGSENELEEMLQLQHRHSNLPDRRQPCRFLWHHRSHAHELFEDHCAAQLHGTEPERGIYQHAHRREQQ